MEFVTKVLRYNVKQHLDSDRMICSELDKSFFDTLTVEEKVTYHCSYVPIKDSALYNFVATYKLQL